MREAVQPVFHWSALAMAAAAKAASATGGVSIDRMPWNSTYMCACIGCSPAWTRAGAARVARIT